MSKRSVLSLAILVVAVLLAVVLVAASCGGTEETTTSAAPATTAATPATTAAPMTTAGSIDAATLFAENCAGCHADGVRGSASEIETMITDGGEDMPAFGDMLSAEEIAALAAYAAGGGK